MRPDHPMLLHRSSAFMSTVGKPQPGFWCEWRHADGERIRSASQRTPESAVRWARLNIRIIASVVGPYLVDRLVDRSDPWWEGAVSALEKGAEFTLPLVAEPFSFVWHARPVLFVTVAGGKPLPHRPSGGMPWG
ncbi:hypothetical protein [Streptomyces sp. 4N124]|uniref:hypothetical protein n=1 Tax=Streptomyces sp. 4N124 TaxID=3457420 RepID=UPI003FD64129